MKTANGQPIESSNNKLNTFAGVFTPSILTILGIILFLRLGYVVGSTGLAQALLIILLANAISLLTSWSVAIIATNMRVKEGGDYYLISRTLGPAFGGSIGAVIFLAQSVSVGFYCIGFGEATAAFMGIGEPWIAQVIAFIAMLGLFVLAWRGVDWATRFQYLVMALVFSGLMFFCMGAIGEFKPAQLEANLLLSEKGLGFWAAFAIFFPAVTGFTQGVSMSGELQNPSRSIPRGLFSAVGLSTLIYLGVAVLLAGSLPAREMSSDYRSFWNLSVWNPAIDAGVMSAALSSALASFLGAPRILHALARDRIFPVIQYFSVATEEGGNPRRALVLSGSIAAGVIFVGDLNMLAGIVTMFFLVSYGLLNFATWFEASSGSPSFRPGIHFYHRSISLLGTLACAAAIMALNPITGAVAIVLFYGIYLYINSRRSPKRWADSLRSYHLQNAREHLIAAAKEYEHPRDWRPQCLIICDDTEAHKRLLHFSSWVTGGGGVSQAIRIIPASEGSAQEHISEQHKKLKTLIEAEEAAAFPLVVANNDRYSALWNACQTAGIGPLRINTIVAAWPPESNRSLQKQTYKSSVQKLVSLSRLQKNILLIHVSDAHLIQLQNTQRKRLDIWCGHSATDKMFLLLAYIFTRCEHWAGSHIRLIARCDNDNKRAEVESHLRQLSEEARIAVEIMTVVTLNVDKLMEISLQSQAIFIPLTIWDKELHHPLMHQEPSSFDHLPILIFGLAVQKIDLDAEPEEGPQASAARIIDRIKHVIALQEEQQLRTDEYYDVLQTMRKQLHEALEQRKPHDELSQYLQALVQAQEQFDSEKAESIRFKTVLDALYERAGDMEIDQELLPARDENSKND